MLVMICWYPFIQWTSSIPNANLRSTRSLGNDGTLFYLTTNKDAPREKIITIDIADPNFTPKDLVPEQKDSKLEYGLLIKDHLVIVYKKDVRGSVEERRR
jgi:prolyl oligopeptidase